MTSGLRLLSVCVVAGLSGTASAGHAETTGLFRPTIAGDEAQIDPVDVQPITPSLTIAPGEEQAPLRIARPITDPYAASGIERGGMTLYPSLEVGAVYTSNVASAAAGAKPDTGIYLKPSLRFASDWVRHSWEGQANGDFIAYLEEQALDSLQADASSKFRLDIRHTTRAEFAASYALDQTGSESSEVPDTATGNRTDQTLAADAALIHDFGPVEGRAKLAIERQLYGDVDLAGGGKEDNSDRNYYTPSLGLRLSYSDPPAVKPFVEFTYAPRFHDEEFDRNGLRRDSHGMTASLGVTLDRDPFWSGEVALVYALRNYEDATLATNDAVGLNGNLTWSPTDLTSVVLNLATTLNETSSAASSGTKTWSGHIDVSHELRENVKLLGGLGLELEQVSGGTDKTLTPSLGVAWQLNPNLAWTAGYDGTWFESADSAGDYNEQRLTTGIIVRR
ncbi:MAG: outer membrane beta-barrel protein [Aestuariivirga sp.]